MPRTARPPPAPLVEFPSEAALLAETNASLLYEYYHGRQVRFRGAAAPKFAGTKLVRDYQDVIRLRDGSQLHVDQLSEAFELMISQIGGQPKAPGGEGSVWNGVDTLIDPVDAAAFSALMWQHQPDLIVEIGTECGGSAVFFATIMRQYTRTGHVLTWDVAPTYRRCSKMGFGRRTWKGYKSALWAQHARDGVLVARTADVTKPSELALIRSYAQRAKVVWVIDDGDHLTTPLLVHFHLLASHVTPGGYYVIADTRLERTCQAAAKIRYFLPYCGQILGRDGGPARAVAFLQNQSTIFRDRFEVDRSPERWVFTQHPGGFLRRKCDPERDCPPDPNVAHSQPWHIEPWGVETAGGGQAASARSHVAHATARDRAVVHSRHPKTDPD